MGKKEKTEEEIERERQLNNSYRRKSYYKKTGQDDKLKVEQETNDKIKGNEK